jgi:hypothetical protein
MAEEKRLDEGPRRREDEALGGPAIGGAGVAPGLVGGLGVPPPLGGADDPARAGAKPAMLGVYGERPSAASRLGAIGPLVLVLVVLGILLLLAYALFAAKGDIQPTADAAAALEPALRLLS